MSQLSPTGPRSTVWEVQIELCGSAASLPRENGLWWQWLCISVRGMYLRWLLLGRLTGICCNEIIQVGLWESVDDSALLILSCRVNELGVSGSPFYHLHCPLEKEATDNIWTHTLWRWLDELCLSLLKRANQTLFKASKAQRKLFCDIPWSSSNEEPSKFLPVSS